MNTFFNDEKTEKPTNLKIKRARNVGNILYFRDLNIFFIFLFMLGTFWIYRFFILKFFINIFLVFFSFDNNILTSYKCIYLYIIKIFKYFMYYFLILFIEIILILISLPFVLNNQIVYFKKIKINFQFLNIFIFFKKIFSVKNILEIGFSILKIIMIYFFSFYYLYLYSFMFLFTYSYSFFYSIHKGYFLIMRILEINFFIFFFFSIFDFFWKKYEYFQSLRMTKQELKNELKNSELNIAVKNRMYFLMQEVRKKNIYNILLISDVIITDLYKYIIIIQYDKNKTSYPVVLFKGKGKVVRKILKLSRNYIIPVFYDIEFTEKLYLFSNVGHFISSLFYQSIAQILIWSWKIKKWKKSGGKYPKKPQNFFIF